MSRPHAIEVNATHLQGVLLVLGAPALATVKRAGLPRGGVLDGGAAGGGVELGDMRGEGHLPMGGVFLLMLLLWLLRLLVLDL